MTQAQTDIDKTQIAGVFPVHHATDRICYTPDDPAIVVPMIRQGWADATIIPASPAFKKELQEAGEQLNPATVRGISGFFRYSLNHPNSMLISEFHKRSIQNCTRFFNTAGYDDGEVRAFVLAYQPDVDFNYAKKLHLDHKINVYTALSGAPMEILTAPVPRTYLAGLIFGCTNWDEQREFLIRNEICDDPEQHLITPELGDTVVFNQNLLHMSSRRVKNGENHKGQGLLAYSLNPTSNFNPYDRVAPSP